MSGGETEDTVNPTEMPSSEKIVEFIEIPPKYSSFPEGWFQEGTFLQRAGLGLFYRVLLATTSVLLFLFGYLFWGTPPYPDTSQSSGVLPDSLSFRLIAEQRSEVFQNFIEGVERIVVAIFLPLLTAILGYLFATRETAETPKGQDSADDSWLNIL